VIALLPSEASSLCTEYFYRDPVTASNHHQNLIGAKSYQKEYVEQHVDCSTEQEPDGRKTYQ
jgi:hypothetical protein